MVDLGALPAALRETELGRLAVREARRPFDLARGPLLRLTLVRLERERHALLLTLHHVVADDWSVGILVRELAEGYRPGDGPPAAAALPVQYADFAVWQRRWLDGGVLAPQLAHWQERLGGELPVLALPTDRPRPRVQSFRGAVLPFALPPALSAALRELGRRTDHTLFMVLLAAYAAALGRRARQDDLVIGTAVAGRNRAEIEGLIGFFVNILPLRIDLSGPPTWRELLERVHETALGAYDHQEMPFEKLVEALDPKRDMSRAALRQVGFAFQNASMRPIAFPGGLEITPLEVDAGVARLDLTLFLWDDGQALRGRCEYATDLFDQGTIAGFVAELEGLCGEMVADLGQRLPAPGETRSAADALAERSNLTEGQLLFWFAQKIHQEGRLYFDRAAVTFTVDAALDPGAFARAFAALVERCDTLRTQFHEVDGVPRRTVVDRPAEPLEVLDLSGEADPEAAYARWLDARGRAPIDLARRPYDSALVRIAPGRTVWFFNAHHIVMDAASLVLLARHLSDLYARALAGTLDQAPEIPSFERYAAAERVYRDSDAYQRAAEYWRGKVAPPLTANDFYRRDQRGGARSAVAERISIDLGTERSLRIQEVCRQGGFYSPSVFFAAALFAYLFRSSGEPRQRIGVPFTNRSEDAEGVIGLVMHACPLAAEVDGGDSFLALANRVQRDAVASTRHQRYPVRNPLAHRAYDVYLNYQNVAFDGLCGHPVRFELLRSGSANEALVLQVRDFNREGRFYLDLDLNLACFPEVEQRERSAGHLLHLLDAFLADPGRPVGAPALLSAAEEEEMARGFNDTRRIYPERGETLHDLIVAQAGHTPEATAVIAEGGSLTYGELLERALRLAGSLQSRGVGPDSVVGISIERSCELSVGLLAILLAGGAYLPLDPNDPPRRLEQTLADSGVALLLTQERLAGRFAGSGADVLCLDRDVRDEAVLADDDSAWTRPAVGGDSIAYVIYTSGSTGRPKGVMVPHRGIVNRLLWMQEAYGLEPSDRVLQKTPVSFDVSVWELFWPLITGARLVMARPGGHRDPGYLVDVIAAQGITTLHFVPSMLQVFLEQEGLERCGSMKRVMASGEALPESLRARFYERLAGPELHNLYGPTEASVDVTFWPCGRQNPLGFVPIGRPIANTAIHIVDRWAHLSPKGLPGELWIGGVGLARGYLRRPELTAERFVPDPWSAEPGARAYRTGDLARRLPDGVLEFLGRFDHQVKLRGFRIELGEIEAALAERSEVREVVVTAREDRPGDLRLVAYLVPRPGAELDVPALRARLRERLPEHMIPAAWVVLDALPLSATGKVDRKALPAPDGQPVAQAAYVAPRTALEALLAGICAQVLGAERVGVHDDFFDLGGSSILATQVVTTVQEILPVDLPLRNVFETPTVAQIADLLEQRFRTLDEEDRASVGEVLAEFERLTGERKEVAT
jgi:amino acid adenylation domain-containing protein